MEKQNQYFKIPNVVLKNNSDCAIYSLLALVMKKYNKTCKNSLETFVKEFGQNQMFYSKALNELSDSNLIIIKTIIQKGGKKLNNNYIIKYNEFESYTTIHSEIINIFEQNYKSLAFYIKLKCWINNNTFIASNITKHEIMKLQNCTKPTLLKYFKILEDLDLIKIEKTDFNIIKLTLTHEIKIKKQDELIKIYNKFGGEINV